MIKSAIDIGSNSVRLGTFADGKTLYKRLATTRLGEGLSFTGAMKRENIVRTARAVCDFVRTAEGDGAEKLYVFATAAVRSASNRDEFLSLVRELCGIEVDVISGETEAEIALLGALPGGDGGIIDLGGASTEVILKKNGARVYARSVDVGAVSLYDLCGRDIAKLEKIIADKPKLYGGFSAAGENMYGVSGTVVTLAAMKLGLKEYDGNAVQNIRLSVDEVENYAFGLLSTPVEKICEMLTVDSRRADIIGGGALLLARLMQNMNINELTVSDRDNLEGYIIYREGEL